MQQTAQIDMGALTNALLALVILSFFVERGLATLFDWKRIQPWLTERQAKVPIAIATSLAVCILLDFDALKTVRGLTDGDPPIGDDYFGFVGIPITALVLAGGSAGAVKLMQDIIGITKQSRDLAREARSETTQAQIAEARERKAKADAQEARARADIEMAVNIAQRSNLHLAVEQATAASRLGAVRGLGAASGIDFESVNRKLRLRELRHELAERQEVDMEKARAIRTRRAEA